LENPIAEGINGIIKHEYLTHCKINDHIQAMEQLKYIVDRYNNERPHQSINMLTPDLVHQNQILVNRRWGKSIVNANIVKQ